MDIATAILSLMTGGIGGLAGATIGAYYGGYNKRKGEIFAEYEDFPTLIAQETRKAYEQEWAKRLATHKDIENVLAEVRKVTSETESIKAQISGDTWLRQTVWVQKRTAYGEILKGIGAFQLALFDVLSLSSAVGDRKGECSVESLAELETDVNVRKVKCMDMLLSVFDRFVEAELFDPSLVTFGLEFGRLQALLELKDDAIGADVNQHSFDDFVGFRRRLARHMRLELGIDAIVSDEDAFNDSSKVEADDQGRVQKF
jgi:hypothetical protein